MTERGTPGTLSENEIERQIADLTERLATVETALKTAEEQSRSSEHEREQLLTQIEDRVNRLRAAEKTARATRAEFETDDRERKQMHADFEKITGEADAAARALAECEQRLSEFASAAGIAAAARSSAEARIAELRKLIAEATAELAALEPRVDVERAAEQRALSERAKLAQRHDEVADHARQAAARRDHAASDLAEEDAIALEAQTKIEAAEREADAVRAEVVNLEAQRRAAEALAAEHSDAHAKRVAAVEEARSALAAAVAERDRRIAERKAAEERARRAQEELRRVAAERAEFERRAAELRAAEERNARERAEMERRLAELRTMEERASRESDATAPDSAAPVSTNGHGAKSDRVETVAMNALAFQVTGPAAPAETKAPEDQPATPLDPHAAAPAHDEVEVPTAIAAGDTLSDAIVPAAKVPLDPDAALMAIFESAEQQRADVERSTPGKLSIFGRFGRRPRPEPEGQSDVELSVADRIARDFGFVTPPPEEAAEPQSEDEKP